MSTRISHMCGERRAQMAGGATAVVVRHDLRVRPLGMLAGYRATHFVSATKTVNTTAAPGRADHSTRGDYQMAVSAVGRARLPPRDRPPQTDGDRRLQRSHHVLAAGLRATTNPVTQSATPTASLATACASIRAAV